MRGILCCVVLCWTMPAQAASRCGLVAPIEDYTEADRHGDLSAFAMTVCAKASALPALRFADRKQGVAALLARRIDLLVGVSPDPSLDRAQGLVDGPTLLDDRQGFLVATRSGIVDVAGLAGRMICVIAGTPTERTLDDAMARRRVRFEPHPFEETGEMLAALAGGSCDAITADRSVLLAMQASLPGGAGAWSIPTETIADDPYVTLRRRP